MGQVGRPKPGGPLPGKPGGSLPRGGDGTPRNIIPARGTPTNKPVSSGDDGIGSAIIGGLIGYAVGQDDCQSESVDTGEM